MADYPRRTYAKNEVTAWPIPNYWDIVAMLLVLAALIALGYGARSMVGVLSLDDSSPISLYPGELPYYALRTVLRLLLAMLCSLCVTFVMGTWAAKSRLAERIIIPVVDILQSVPILGFLTITLPVFMALFPGRMLGPECAAIFAIFTAQVWNMIFSFYQSLSTVPRPLTEACAVLQLSPWQRFWRLEAPFAMPGLLWNTMMSMSGSWVFLVASEVMTVAHHHILLPGIGSYIAVAIQQTDRYALGYAILTMFLVIILYDQLLFRPLLAWAEKFKMQVGADEEEPSSWILNLFQRTRFLYSIGHYLSLFGEWFINGRSHSSSRQRIQPGQQHEIRFLVYFLLGALVIIGMYLLLDFVVSTITAAEMMRIFYLGGLTGLRVIFAIIVSSIVWIPLGVWIGFRPSVTRVIQPIAQFLSAFPINLLFPIAVLLILKFHLNVNIWVAPLMVLGTQWYILFNVIVGVKALPKNLCEVAGTFNVKGVLWWRRLILPGIFPYYITGAITAAGGAWNISILAEVIQWGHIKLHAQGLGAYIVDASSVGDFHRLVLGIMVMALYVFILNRLIWGPLFRFSQEHFQVG